MCHLLSTGSYLAKMAQKWPKSKNAYFYSLNFSKSGSTFWPVFGPKMGPKMDPKMDPFFGHFLGHFLGHFWANFWTLFLAFLHGIPVDVSDLLVQEMAQKWVKKWVHFWPIFWPIFWSKIDQKLVKKRVKLDILSTKCQVLGVPRTSGHPPEPTFWTILARLTGYDSLVLQEGVQKGSKNTLKWVIFRGFGTPGPLDGSLL